MTFDIEETKLKILALEHIAATLGEMADELAETVDTWRNRACNCEADAVRLRGWLAAHNDGSQT